jgi:hypothetical protein
MLRSIGKTSKLWPSFLELLLTLGDGFWLRVKMNQYDCGKMDTCDLSVTTRVFHSWLTEFFFAPFFATRFWKRCDYCFFTPFQDSGIASCSCWTRLGHGVARSWIIRVQLRALITTGFFFFQIALQSLGLRSLFIFNPYVSIKTIWPHQNCVFSLYVVFTVFTVCVS